MIINPKILHEGTPDAAFFLKRSIALDLDWERVLGRPRIRRQLRDALSCIAASMRMAAIVKVQVIIPRNRNGKFYKESTNSSALFSIGQSPVMAALDILIERGLVKTIFKSSYAAMGRASSYAPTDQFINFLLNPSAPVRYRYPRGCLVIRDYDRNELVSYPLTNPVCSMASNLLIINNNILNHIKGLHPSNNIYNRYNNIYRESSTEDYLHLAVYSRTDFVNYTDFILDRKFRGGLNKGGRFYAPFQNMSSQERLKLIIGHSDVVELDYTAMHPTMLYNRILRSTDGIDMYGEKSGHDRKLIKKALIVMFNTKSEVQALRALAKKLRNTKGKERFVKARSAIETVKTLHPLLMPFFFTSNSLDLQYLDSQVAEKIMLRFAVLNKLCLGVHDSFIVKSEDEQLLREVMRECYEEVMGKGTTPKIEKKLLKDA